MNQNNPKDIFVSGKVMMDDGTSPPDAVIIERVCNGTPRPEAYTDSKGRFSFQVGKNNGVFYDASNSMIPNGSQNPMSITTPAGTAGVGSRVDPNGIRNCQLRASLAGFRSDVVELADRRALDDPNVGTIFLHPLARTQGYTFSATSAYAPKGARKAFDKGVEAANKGRWADAHKEFEKATNDYPKYAAAWYNLGRILMRESNGVEAKNAYAKAIESDPKFLNPYAELARISAKARDWEAVAKYTDTIIHLNPYFSAESYLYNSVAYLELNKFDLAEASAREAIKMDTEHKLPQIHHVLALTLADKQDYLGAAQSLRTYVAMAPMANDNKQARGELADMERRLASVRKPVQAAQE